MADDQKASFTSRGFWRGVRLGLPFAATSLVHGLLFGVVALEAELAVWDAVMMSSLVASGSAQFAAMEIWGRPLAVGALATVTLLVNLRYVLLGSTLPALFATLSPLQRYSGAYFLNDESWAITMQDFQAGFTDAAVLLGSGAAVYSGWYERVVTREVLPAIAAKEVAGYRGIELLRRDARDEVEFMTVMWFDSLDAVREFAGADYETAYVPPAARAVLGRFDERSSHYQVREKISY